MDSQLPFSAEELSYIAARDLKKDLKTALRNLQDKRQLFKKVKSDYDQTANCIKNLRAVAKTRAHCSLQEPQMFSGALIDEAKHLGNLKFRVWEKMQEIVQYTSVILDPNTAHPELSVSDDLTSVQRSYGTQHLPNNPERFDQSYCVLGSEAFTSGIQIWDTEVTDVPDWEKISGGIKRGCWFVFLDDLQHLNPGSKHPKMMERSKKADGCLL
ncbi:E3 ubiquitin-protein ligase TRIM35-like [Tachysurus ichikawai]